MKLVDANIIIRFLTRDDKPKAEKCKKLFEAAAKGEVSLYISDLVMAELVWVLYKFYACNKTAIREMIEIILNTPNLIFENKEVISESSVLFEVRNVDFIDAYHVALMRQRSIRKIYSFDRDFDAFPEIERIEP